VKYISTRGCSPELSFEEVMLTGLAPDGGLYVPKELPFFDSKTIESWKSLSYAELAFKVIQPFVDGCIADDDLEKMIHECYAEFRHDDVAPLVDLNDGHYILELFHGPTLAFKDFALQLLGRLLNHVLEKRQQKAVILGATSGDTGSAAIEGCRHCNMLDIFILHPYNRVSDVQRKQMTTVLDTNVHNFAVKGNFDDCQKMVKDSFSNQSFLSDDLRLIAVNSINWARIMAQIVYYFYATIKLGSDKPVAYSVPTGNFGDIFAGYLAKKMGLNISQLIVATNSNDILHRYLQTNNYEISELIHTCSPSMDIMVSSNFERLLFDAMDRQGDQLSDFMMRSNKEQVSLPSSSYKKIRELFDSYSVQDDETVETIRSCYNRTGYLLDPHTAIAYRAALKVRASNDNIVTLATAHPAKFPDPILQAGYPHEPDLPDYMSDLMSREERFDVVENDLNKVHELLNNKL
jgi:threonine synthase